MYICLCFGVSDKTIKDLILSKGVASIRELQKLCKAGTNCGSCVCEIKKFLPLREQGTLEVMREAESVTDFGINERLCQRGDL